MSNYDPSKQPCDPVYSPCGDCPSCIAGPGGSSIVTENNEKGMQETALFKVIAMHQEAELGSNHDPERQGIYATNSVGDND
jgi:hypothetical protein